MGIKLFIDYIKESYATDAATQFQMFMQHCITNNPRKEKNSYSVEDVLSLAYGSSKILDNLLGDHTLKQDNAMFPTRLVAEHMHTLDLDSEVLSNFSDSMSLYDLQYLAHLTNLPDDHAGQLLAYIFKNHKYVDQVFGHDFTTHLESLRCWFHTSPIMTVYRSIALPMDKAELRKSMESFDGIGRYWTYERSSATSYWNDKGGSEYLYLVQATVTVDDVDWVNTVFKSLYSLKDENEIYLNANATPKINQVWHGSNIIKVNPVFVDVGTMGDY